MDLLGIGERAVNIEYQGFEHDSPLQGGRRGWRGARPV